MDSYWSSEQLWGKTTMRGLRYGISLGLILAFAPFVTQAGEQPSPVLSDYFPPPEEQGGWRTLLPAAGEPDDSQKAQIREVGGVDWDLLKAAWDHNTTALGRPGYWSSAAARSSASGTGRAIAPSLSTSIPAQSRTRARRLA